MFESVHRAGSGIRNSRLLKNQACLWKRVEPAWQGFFRLLARRRGFATQINSDVFRLEYSYGSRYDRADKRRYEPAFYLPFVDRIREGMTVFDVGAHIGIFTLGAAARVGPSGQVVAFEPAPETARVLERHVLFNGFLGRVEVVPAVVSDRSGTVAFYTYRQSMAASLARANVDALNPEKRHEPVEEITVGSVTLDDYCGERGAWPEVIKIDVEGASRLRRRRGSSRSRRASRAPAAPARPSTRAAARFRSRCSRPSD